MERLPIAGNRQRLREVVEQLLKNATQAIASESGKDPGLEHTIRLTVSHEGVEQEVAWAACD